MSPSQAVLVLIIGYLYASSASLLQTEKLAPEDVSPTKFLPALTIGSTATSQGRFRTSLNTLTGYVTSVTYSDTSCKSTESVVVELLNSCIRTGKETSQFVTATSSSVTRSRYSDSLCTIAAKVTMESYTDGACVSSRKTSINPTSEFTADVATASMKKYPSADSTCSKTPTLAIYHVLNTCLNGTSRFSVSGSQVTVNVFSATQCTGSSTPISYEMESCTTYEFSPAIFSSSEYSVSPFFDDEDATGGQKGCFAGSETLHLESGEVRFISDIRVGDRVLAADAAGRMTYSDVVFVPHKANNDNALFTHITTASGRDIKMTSSHIILAGPCHPSAPLPLTYASFVNVGDCVMTVSGKDMVSTVETVQGKGLYTIVTKEEYVVVNGIIASPFAANHMLANLYYNVHRFVYASAPSLLNYQPLHFANEALGSVIPYRWFSC